MEKRTPTSKKKKKNQNNLYLEDGEYKNVHFPDLSKIKC